MSKVFVYIPNDPYYKSEEFKASERIRQRIFYQKNREQKLQYSKERREENKGIIFHCELCNRDVSLNSQRAHLKTKIHQSKINEIK